MQKREEPMFVVCGSE
uniref:BAHD acyltransferase n=1 Tax=Rhizophora mucronata TaxID=61149 RepID=A0A2P2KYJ5_RHIMU